MIRDNLHDHCDGNRDIIIIIIWNFFSSKVKIIRSFLKTRKLSPLLFYLYIRIIIII